MCSWVQFSALECSDWPFDFTAHQFVAAIHRLNVREAFRTLYTRNAFACLSYTVSKKLRKIVFVSNSSSFLQFWFLFGTKTTIIQYKCVKCTHFPLHSICVADADELKTRLSSNWWVGSVWPVDRWRRYQQVASSLISACVRVCWVH